MCSFNFCIVTIIACLYDCTKKAPASFTFLNNHGAEFFTSLIIYCEAFSGEVRRGRDMLINSSNFKALYIILKNNTNLY